MANSKILVTGATGATGGSAVRELRAGGHEVRALVHEDDERAESLRALGVEVAIGNLLDIDSVRAALEDVRSAYFVYPLFPSVTRCHCKLRSGGKGNWRERDREHFTNDVTSRFEKPRSAKPLARRAGLQLGRCSCYESPPHTFPGVAVLSVLVGKLRTEGHSRSAFWSREICSDFFRGSGKSDRCNPSRSRPRTRVGCTSCWGP